MVVSDLVPEDRRVNSRDEEDEVDSSFRDPVGDGPLAVVSYRLVVP